ncbi:hypothetical protein ILUMI_25717 [Ignelater luminosus]|uniref:Uncharacterized protein n=1 Tax=Ignelater luminosus TaxID=2038154 RepID=A0A8K0FZS2_IGNLU|nr:hypothetical protein ILUMI_25717 [Ignelater luminosus]
MIADFKEYFGRKSNNPNLFTKLNISHSTSMPGKNTVCIASSEVTKILGIHWSPADNTLNYRVHCDQNSDRVIKCQLLSEISKVFDPLGVLSHCTVLGKIILQHVWQEETDWNESISSSLNEKWEKLQVELPLLNHIKIPGHASYKDVTRLELHTFSDASENANGRCIYLR